MIKEIPTRGEIHYTLNNFNYDSFTARISIRIRAYIDHLESTREAELEAAFEAGQLRRKILVKAYNGDNPNQVHYGDTVLRVLEGEGLCQCIERLETFTDYQKESNEK